MIQSDEYLLNCYRYIEQNPLRAGMVQSPGQYLWSSYRHNALGEDDDLITEHASYTQLGTSKIARLNAYRDMLAESLDDDWLERIRKAHPGNRALGDSLFLAQLNGGIPKADHSPALSFGLV
ncbi:hypothetical protein E4L96_17700 [Massilia arenosa]|uniref:Transposase n=1 Tax=Zemynaea arenosa TaxID=2561931 RepID=A0A4Y9S372_9BURK|nr:hypothetical protein [Massilia arenosa]TFW15744.1 hypothetical protein E4L96_17700 [Massilia arenosa]